MSTGCTPTDYHLKDAPLAGLGRVGGASLVLNVYSIRTFALRVIFNSLEAKVLSMFGMKVSS